MKLLLIKVGKAFSAIRKEGVLRGGKRVLQGFFSLFGRVEKGDVLIVTGGIGDSARYRAHHVAEELNLNGIKTSITVQDNPFLAKYPADFKVLIFHRVLFTSSVKKMIEKAKSLGREIVFETDDLVYNPKFLKFMDYYKQMNSMERKLYENGVGGEIIGDEYVKVCTTTTSYLATKLKEEGKQIFLVPNRLSLEDLDLAKEALEQTVGRKKDGGEVVIGYFSGTISHNKDFATITKPLMNILEKFPETKLFLAGPLDPEDELVSKFKNRIINTPYVPRREHFKNLASVDINVVPLEMDNPFCEAKSELKYFEAGIVKVPTVAVANQTFSEAIEDGVDGFVAKNSTEWEMKLGKLILDRDLREKIGQAAYEKTLAKYTTKNAKNEEYYGFLKEAIGE
jgi:O-antigen biosynthesis protein